MKGSIVYDISTTVGVIILVFMIIYWSLVYGTDMVAQILLSSPAVVQASIASALSFGCRTENYEFTYSITKPSQFDLVLTDRAINAIPPTKKLRDWTTTERGGYIQYKGIPPSPLITCELSPTPSTNSFSTTGKNKINIVKNSSFFGMEVK